MTISSLLVSTNTATARHCGKIVEDQTLGQDSLVAVATGEECPNCCGLPGTQISHLCSHTHHQTGGDRKSVSSGTHLSNYPENKHYMVVSRCYVYQQNINIINQHFFVFDNSHLYASLPFYQTVQSIHV